MSLPAPASLAPRPGPAGRSITDLTVSIPTNSAPVPPSTTRPLWRTREFAFYYVVFALVVPLMVYVPVRLSSPTHPNYALYAHRLSPGWLGRQVDNSDPQYRSFRSNLCPLLGLAALYLVPAQLVRHLYPFPLAPASAAAEPSHVHAAASVPPAQPHAPPASPAHPRAVRARVRFLAGAALALLVVLHGVGALKILAILALNYALALAPKGAGRWARAWPAAVIVGNMALLFVNERTDGWRLGSLHAALRTPDVLGGLLPRWHVSFNITMLRIVSFALDVHWQTPAPSDPPTDHRGRTTTSAPVVPSFALYLAYTLYPPLYIAGPIMTYNDFAHQLARPPALAPRARAAYAARVAASLLAMEATLHAMWVVAIKDAGAWDALGPADMCLVGFWNLVVVWLKLLIPWRFFRLWALLDGVDPPENMVRCVANNYSTLGFWRSWHRSYNLWLLRYIYIPLGGGRNVVLSTVLVFTFVALWHDLSFRLLAWGWLVSLFVLPELAARRAVPAHTFGARRWFRHAAAVGGVANIAMMMAANLVGFVVGLDGVARLGAALVGSPGGAAFLVIALACLFVAVQVMREYRAEERRRGIDRKC
ncbi:glycerol transporter [Cryptotrichosporon argae]